MKNIVVFSGAGMSAESGIKTFRDSDGLWEEYKIEDVATPMAWQRQPGVVLDFYNKRRAQIAQAQPNAAHKLVAELEKQFKVTVITQNIDDLHERAGSKNVVHLHGEIFKARSSYDPTHLYSVTGDMQLGDKCEHGSQLRPNIVWFHEEVPLIPVAAKIISKTDILIVIGTSLAVYPAAGLVDYAPHYSTKFLIDPKIPQEATLRNFKLINKTASEGMKEVFALISEQ